MKKVFLLSSLFVVLLMACSPTRNASHPTNSKKETRGFSYASFASFSGPDSVFKNKLPIVWAYWKKEVWPAMEKLVIDSALNSGWPPAQGFANMDTMTLLPGTMLDRFGWPGGDFVAPKGTPFCERALPYSSLGKPYFVYTVVKPIHAVSAGKAIPWFNQKGMGMQYKFTGSVSSLLNAGFLKATDSVMGGKMDTSLLKGSAR